MYENANVEVIVRGVCVVDGELLLCHGKKVSLTYLPGGHIEFRETARQALVREIKEEMGRDAEAGRFLRLLRARLRAEGHAARGDQSRVRVGYSGAQARLAGGRRRGVDRLQWQLLEKLDEANLEPAPLRELIGAWLKHPGGHFVSGDAWERCGKEELGN